MILSINDSVTSLLNRPQAAGVALARRIRVSTAAAVEVALQATIRGKYPIQGGLTAFVAPGTNAVVPLGLLYANHYRQLVDCSHEGRRVARQELLG